MWPFSKNKNKQVEKIVISQESYDSLLPNISEYIGTLIDSICEMNKLKVSSGSDEDIKIKNPSENASVKDFKNLYALMVDNELIDILISKIVNYLNIEIYNHIITVIDSEKLKTINGNIEKSDTSQDIQIDIDNVIDKLKDKNYIGIFKKIRETILDSELSIGIKDVVKNAEQFNFILINSVKFVEDNDLLFTKEMFLRKKYTIDYIYEYSGTISKFTDLIKSLLEEKRIVIKCYEAFDIEKTPDAVVSLTESENLLTEEDKEETKDVENQMIKVGNKKILKQAMKDKKTYIIAGGSALIFGGILCFLYYYMTYVGF